MSQTQKEGDPWFVQAWKKIAAERPDFSMEDLCGNSDAADCAKRTLDWVAAREGPLEEEPGPNTVTFTMSLREAGASGLFKMLRDAGYEPTPPGTFGAAKATECLCRKCGAQQVTAKAWDSACGGYTDHKYSCADCAHTWWIDGADA